MNRHVLDANCVTRRDFLASAFCSVAVPALAPAASSESLTTLRKFLRDITCTRQEVETFLDPHEPNWARFDPELGYTLRDNVLKDGVDGSRTLTSYVSGGERTTINYARRPCRINAYGDSFTQCHQASDGETWEEYLVAHLGEPIRNFGIGGYGTYQAYRRMLRRRRPPRPPNT